MRTREFSVSIFSYSGKHSGTLWNATSSDKVTSVHFFDVSPHRKFEV